MKFSSENMYYNGRDVNNCIWLET